MNWFSVGIFQNWRPTSRTSLTLDRSNHLQQTNKWSLSNNKFDQNSILTQNLEDFLHEISYLCDISWSTLQKILSCFLLYCMNISSCVRNLKTFLDLLLMVEIIWIQMRPSGACFNIFSLEKMFKQFYWYNWVFHVMSTVNFWII